MILATGVFIVVADFAAGVLTVEADFAAGVDCDGHRQTEVENQYTRFIPPDVTLSRYLEMRRS